MEIWIVGFNDDIGMFTDEHARTQRFFKTEEHANHFIEGNENTFSDFSVTNVEIPDTINGVIAFLNKYCFVDDTLLLCDKMDSSIEEDFLTVN